MIVRVEGCPGKDAVKVNEFNMISRRILRHRVINMLLDSGAI